MKFLWWLAFLFFTTAFLPAQTPLLRHEDPAGGTLRGIANSPAGLVAIGANGHVLTSSDGITWVARNSGMTDNFTAVASGAGVFVAVTDSGRVLMSSDGVAWNMTLNEGVRLNSVAFSGGFVVVGDSATLLRSDNGWSWSKDFVPVGASLTSVAAPNSLYHAVGSSGAWVEYASGEWQMRAPGKPAISRRS